MQVYAQMAQLVNSLVRLAEQTPKDEDVTAGGTAAAIFVLLILAVAVLGFSLFKHLRKAQAAEKAGVYDETPAESTERPDDQGRQPS